MTEEKTSLWEAAKDMGEDALDKVEDIGEAIGDKVSDAGEAIGDKLTGGDDSETT